MRACVCACACHTPRKAGQRLFHPSNSHTLPGQPLWLQGAGRVPFSPLSPCLGLMVVAAGRHGDGRVSAPAQQAATACRPARRTLQIRCSHAHVQPSFSCAASVCDRGQLRMPVSFAAVLPRWSARSLSSASALVQREAPRTRRCARVCAHVQCLSQPCASIRMILAPGSLFVSCVLSSPKGFGRIHNTYQYRSLL